MRALMGNVVIAEAASTGAIAERYGLSREGVWAAIRDGRLPAIAIRGRGGKCTYAVRWEDAEEEFGRRHKRKLSAAEVNQAFGMEGVAAAAS